MCIESAARRLFGTGLSAVEVVLRLSNAVKADRKTRSAVKMLLGMVAAQF